MEGENINMGYKPLKKATLTGQIMEQIAGMITSDQLKLGDKLPNGRDLVELFGVTRSRIQEALRTFSLMGILTIKPGDDSFVGEEGTKVPEEIVMWVYYQKMNRRDEIYTTRNLTETKMYLTCYDDHTPEILERLDGFRDKLSDAETEEIAAKAFYQLLAGVDTYVGDVCDNGMYARLIQIVVLMGKESAMKILSPALSKENAAFYHCKVLNSFHQSGRNKVGKYLNNFFKCSVREISIRE